VRAAKKRMPRFRRKSMKIAVRYMAQLRQAAGVFDRRGGSLDVLRHEPVLEHV
jgi:hypothetical protein